MSVADATGGAALFAAIGFLSAAAAEPQGKPDIEAAIAVAIVAEFSDWVGFNWLDEVQKAGEEVPLCLSAKVSFNLEAVATHLSDTVVRSFASRDCTSETVEGDFGMFTALTSYYDPNGKDAAHLTIAAATCVSTTQCSIDIDSRGAGMRYMVERKGGKWEVVSQDMRWIV